MVTLVRVVVLLTLEVVVNCVASVVASGRGDVRAYPARSPRDVTMPGGDGYGAAGGEGGGEGGGDDGEGVRASGVVDVGRCPTHSARSLRRCRLSLLLLVRGVDASAGGAGAAGAAAAAGGVS